MELGNKNCVLLKDLVFLSEFQKGIQRSVIYSHNKYAYIHIYMFMQKYTYICWIHTDAMNNRRNDKDARRKTQEDLFNKILPLTLLQGFEKVVWGFTVRGSWRPNITEIFWPHCYDRHVVSFLFSRAAQPEA